ENTGTEITPAAMWEAFRTEYLETGTVARLVDHDVHTSSKNEVGQTRIEATVALGDETVEVTGAGEGPVEAIVHALAQHFDINFDVVDYSEHAIGSGADAKAVAYVEAVVDGGHPKWGIGIDANITTASLKAVLGALARQLRLRSAG
ncbi:MAG: 2-isopropylmalate synthase, partial [Acidimicrobiia bacterium]|nr:2-isopropylmalate synthase [Acidimicrobiia bacterium]